MCQGVTETHIKVDFVDENFRSRCVASNNSSRETEPGANIESAQTNLDFIAPMKRPITPAVALIRSNSRSVLLTNDECRSRSELVKLVHDLVSWYFQFRNEMAGKFRV